MGVACKHKGEENKPKVALVHAQIIKQATASIQNEVEIKIDCLIARS